MKRLLLVLALLLAPVAARADRTVTVRSDCTGYSDCYTSLNGALAGESGDLSGVGILTIECYEFTDSTTATTGTGYTNNDATHYINITVPVAERHDGTPNGGGYLLSGSGSPMLTIVEDYTRVTGLHVVTSASHAVYVNSENVLIDKTLVKGGGRQGLYTDAANANGLVVQNSLAYRCGRSGFDISLANVTFKNCTVAECARNGFSRNSGTMTVTNCLGYSNGDGSTYFDFLGTMTVNYCASDDSTADDNGGTGNVVDIDFTGYFVDAANNDFHLTANATSVLDAGTSTSMPSDDVDGDSRPQNSVYDIGFDEYLVTAGGGGVFPFWINDNEVIQ